MSPSGQIIFNQKSNPSFITKHQNLVKSSPIPQKTQSDQVQKGAEEAAKEIVKEDEKSKLKLNELLDRSEKVMLKITTVFPFVLFPVDVVIDANKVDIYYRTFFFSEHIHSVFIKDITDVMVETMPFFATLKIIDSGYTDNSINIPWLWKDEALQARRIIQGLVVSSKEGVDLSILDQNSLANKMEEIGKVRQIE